MKCITWKHWFCIEETNPSKLKKIFNKLLEESGFLVLGFTEHHFSDGSYVVTFVLAESHFTLRTRPKEGITYCEISSCIRSKYVTFLGFVEPVSVSTTKLEFWSHQLTVGQTDEKNLKEIFSRLFPKATFRVVEFAEYLFPGDGCTLAYIGEDWHLNVHTFPEDKKSVVEVTSFSRGRFFLFTRMLGEGSIERMLGEWSTERMLVRA